MVRLVTLIDSLTGWFGRAFAWLILLMAFAMGYEVLSRYLFNAPTAWAYDLSYMMYGTLLMMGGAYTLSRNAHVRGDFLYRLWPPRVQAGVELVLYFLFFFPGILALIFAGAKYAGRSWRYLETSVFSPAGVPIFHFKTVIVVAGVLLLLQGIAQVCRCILCLRTGEWMQHEEDVVELEEKLAREAKERESYAGTDTMSGHASGGERA
ncbi:TRAP transporter small permease subunit [Spiribacter halobius]|uniref:TRAP transporter small permease protein n=1 Tax=Sediminicurvatus halobius TaxID=2182432 RepID=A0A2U2MZJ0_9GAMM|nr:TRAP transporter small permease subunit [Spiribacter halobius]PWG62395.1 TRAP transporter permease DctQ [Spiribacter halobius]UEX79493.1 TRAP transporter small permease subunit [Spiribacter halobius]